jgi:hypothetical protein
MTFGDYDDSHWIDVFGDDGIESDCDDLGDDDVLRDENGGRDDETDLWLRP